MYAEKGGSGKTTGSQYLGSFMATQGHTVLLVDADAQCNLTGYNAEQKDVEDGGEGDGDGEDEGEDEGEGAPGDDTDVDHMLETARQRSHDAAIAQVNKIDAGDRMDTAQLAADLAKIDMSSMARWPGKGGAARWLGMSSRRLTHADMLHSQASWTPRTPAC